MEGFRSTHVVPEGGLPSWEGPDPSRPSARLDALLPVMLAGASGDWARVVCSNGWTCWVDGRLLVALPQRPPAAGRPVATEADPRPLLAELEAAIGRYRELLDEYADGRLSLEDFRARTAGLRVGAVLDGPSAWLLDVERGRWSYCAAAQLQPYATVEPAEGGTGRA
ncbi:hypothetical protein [Kitasatospora sp. NPDC004289]